MTSKEMTITATSAGYVGGDKASIAVDGQEIGFGNYGRGFNMAVFEETTGKPLFCTNFDTPIGASDMLAQVIDSLPDGRIVALAVKGDAIGDGSVPQGLGLDKPLSDKAKQALKTIGSDQIDQLQAYQSYTLIGIKGTSPGTARESISWSEISSSYSLEVEAVKAKNAFTVSAISRGATVEITINGSAVAIEGGYKTGLNVAVIDSESGQLETSANFDIKADTNKIEEFAQFIENLEPGKIVALSTMGDVSTIKNYSQGEKACRAIGSTLIKNIQTGDSWVIVGYKGAKPGKATENLDNISKYNQYIGNAAQGIAVKYWVLPTVPLNKHLKLVQKLEKPSGASGMFSRNFDNTIGAAGIDGNYAIIGDCGKGHGSGAYVYHWENGRWQSQEMLTPNVVWSGSSVDISGKFAILGDYQGKGSYIFELKDNKWHYKQKLNLPHDIKLGDKFGISVAIDGKVAIVGAIGADVPSGDCGAAYAYQLQNGRWGMALRKALSYVE